MHDQGSGALGGKALEAVTAIAELLSDSRLTRDKESTWLGTTTHREPSGALRYTHGTIGPGLYYGVAGIALFLAEAAARTGRSGFADAALAAISHAFARAHDTPTKTRLGFYVGLPGIAFAANRVGNLLDRTDVCRHARRMMLELTRGSTTGTLLDVIAGAAGSAPIILAFADEWQSDELTDFARRLGRSIVARADKTATGWSWGTNATGFASARNLTGFAHGAAGFGWSLFELHRKLGDEIFARGARGAFRYERRWFRKNQDNWPDFREIGVAKGAPCRLAWCHGSPGIGMSRLAAAASQGGDPYLRDVDAAVRSSQAALAKSLDTRDYSLCHGMLGIAEFLLMASAITREKTAGSLAMAFASRGADAFAHRPDEWPSGRDRGHNPSLMVGLAGIGYFYLRVAFSDVPSVLLPGSAPDSALPAQRPANRRRAARAESTVH